MTSAIPDEVLVAHRAGINVLRPKRDGSKRPDVATWTEYQSRRVTDDELRSQYSNGQTGRIELGLMTGAISRGLEMMEFEARAVAMGLDSEFLDVAEAAGLGDLVSRVFQGYLSRSPSTGIHLLTFSDYMPPSTVLAALPPAGPNEKAPVLIETRGNPGYTIEPPSGGGVHETGKPYEMLAGGVATIETITAEERRALHDLARSFDRRPPKPNRKAAKHTEPRNDGMLLPGTDYNRRGPTCLEQLVGVGWREVYTDSDGRVHLRRPGQDKTRGVSGNVTDKGEGVFYCWTSSMSPFEAEQCYDRFGVHALLSHGGDFAAAARALYAEGYGDRAQAKGSDGEGAAGQGQEPTAEGSLRLLTLKARLLTADALNRLPPPEPLIDGVLTRNTLALAYGRPGVGKTFVTTDAGLSVASGTWWFRHEVHAGPVLYIAAEGTGGLGLRQRAWMEARRIHALPGMFWLPRAVRLLDPSEVEGLCLLVADLQPVLVVVDTLSRCLVGGDENQPRDMTLAVDALDRVRQVNGATVFAVHHSPKDGGTPRGHSALEGAADTIIEVSATDDMVKLVSKKAKDALPFTTIQLQRIPVGESCVLTDRLSSSDELSEGALETLRVLADIDDGAGVSTTTWTKAAPGVAVRSFYRWQKRLVEDGFAAASGEATRKRYTLTDLGRQVLTP